MGRWTNALSHFLGGLRKHVAHRLTEERRGGGGGDDDDVSDAADGGEPAEPEDDAGGADAGAALASPSPLTWRCHLWYTHGDCRCVKARAR